MELCHVQYIKSPASSAALISAQKSTFLLRPRSISCLCGKTRLIRQRFRYVHFLAFYYFDPYIESKDSSPLPTTQFKTQIFSTLPNHRFFTLFCNYDIYFKTIIYMYFVNSFIRYRTV